METRGYCARSVACNRSYRTYEEWKLLFLCSTLLVPVRSYRTYEEWKLPAIVGISPVDLVLTVPMRNGNFVCIPAVSVHTVLSSYRTYEEWKRCTGRSSGYRRL